MNLTIGAMPSAAELQTYFEQHIPITRQMGLQVAHLELSCIRISAPLKPNINDKQSAFGGSLSSLLTLAAWGLLTSHLCAKGIAAEVMIHKGELLYNLPVTSDFSAYCDLPDPAIWRRFMRALQARGRSRVIANSWIAGQKGAAVTLEGHYAVIIK